MSEIKKAFNMRILHTGDWHIGNFPGPEIDGENARFQDICKCLDYLAAIALQEFPDLIIISGDVFHQERVWASRGLKESQTAIHYLRRISKIAPVCILRGTPNHDGEEQFNSLRLAFENNHEVIIIDKPGVHKVYLNGKGNGPAINVAALPGFDRGYYRAKHPGLSKEEENKVFTSALETMIIGLKAQCDPAYPSVLSTHFTVTGANTESGQTQLFMQYEPVIEPATLAAANFDLVCLGHIHRPQQLDGCKNAFYSGSIFGLNFNDEGQARGFYIHQIYGAGGTVHSEFHQTPAREFKTIKLGDDEIGQFNLSQSLEFYPHIEEVIGGKIVRVIYDCTDEHNKALNKTLMERLLYQLGAFWVHEITPQKISITVGKKALFDSNSPEDNLRNHLAEKEHTPERINDILEAATPIISEALEKNLTEAKTGVFTPVEIEVKNYRNYRNELFSFDNIRFCTINGSNGVGKSSLFMDAIADALFEETREGDITGWICNDEAARSGMIKFTFRLGDRLYRVTRTRQKSGKATLNISEMVKGEWVDRSHEKYKDTQAEILNIIGMDSLTLKACALIMQDQYGLFLQADKEARMAILGNILGLGIYGDMEEIAANKLTEENRTLRSIEDKLTNITAGLPDAEKLAVQIDERLAIMEELRKVAAAKTAEAGSIKAKLNTLLEAEQRVIRLQGNIVSLKNKKARLEGDKTAQAAIIFQADAMLEQADRIADGVKEYNTLLEQEKQAIVARSELDMLTRQKSMLQSQIILSETMLKRLSSEEAGLKGRIASLNANLSKEEEYVQKRKELEAYTAETAEIKAYYNEHIALESTAREAETNLAKLTIEREHGENNKKQVLAALMEKAKLLENSSCIDSERASCKFLADAIAAKELIPTANADLEAYREESVNILEKASGALKSASEALANTKYMQGRINEIEGILVALRPYEGLYAQLEQQRQQLKDCESRLEVIGKEKSENEEHLAENCNALAEVEKKLETAAIAAESYKDLTEKLAAAKEWTEKEKMLPLASERKQAAALRIVEIENEIAETVAELEEKSSDLAKEKLTAQGSEELQRQVTEYDWEIAKIQEEINQHAINLGGLKKQQEQAEEARKKCKDLQKQAEEHSRLASIYEELKKAFSQDGIPHNIIRSIIPIFEATATNILGQMSGGKMSVELLTEKVLKSNNKKEVTTLDIIINDATTGSLPYMSRSGGERVKAALSVILALSEIKSTKAGVQLGFLFIDEPPFLDNLGVQAYCDALEAIQSRYPELKVMAITHDPAMKSRFPQSITVFKDENGSYVIRE